MLKDQIFQQKFDEDGYLVVDFFSQDEINALVEAFDDLHNFDIGKDIFFSNLYRDKKYQERARATIRQFLTPKVNQFFKNADWLEAVFVIKPPGCEKFANHQDWTMVEETKHRAYCVW